MNREDAKGAKAEGRQKREKRQGWQLISIWDLRF